MSGFRHFAVSALALAFLAPLSVAAQVDAPTPVATLDVAAIVAALQAQFANADGLVAKVTKRNMPAGRGKGVVSTGWLRITTVGTPALRLDLMAEDKLALVAIVTGQQLWMYQGGPNDQASTQNMDNTAMLQMLRNLAQIEQNFTVTPLTTAPSQLMVCTGCTYLKLDKKNAGTTEKPLYVAVNSTSKLVQISIPYQGAVYWNFEMPGTPTIHQQGTALDVRLNASWFTIPTGLAAGTPLSYLDANGKAANHNTGKYFKTATE